VGDVNGDCAFTSFDVRVLSEYVANLGPTVCASQLDPTRDQAVSGQDALYLLYAVAGKLRKRCVRNTSGPCVRCPLLQRMRPE